MNPTADALGLKLPLGEHRRILVAAALVLTAFSVSLLGSVRSALAYSAGFTSPTQVLTSANYDFGLPIFANFSWVASASAVYSKGDPGGANPYTVTTRYTHDVHTTVSYDAWDLYAHAQFDFYSSGGGAYVTTLSDVFAGCVLPVWTVWMCGSGPVSILSQPNPATVHFQGTLTTSPPWFPYSGNSYSTSFSYS